VHGHRKRELNRAIKKQLEKVAHSTLLGLSNVPSIELAEELIRHSPKGLTKVFYSDNGSTAVEVALKMAYQYWQHIDPKSTRNKFISFHEAYHGDTLGAVSVGGVKLFHEVFRPLLFEVRRFPSPYFFRERTKKLIEMMDREVHSRENEYIGVIMEPLIQGAAGMLTHPKGFLKEIREYCDRHHLLLILDEVATGFGRSGKMFACNHEGVTPDLMAIAKGITGGYLPLAATLAKEKIYRAFSGKYAEFKTFFHGHTYTGNPLACAAALASLKIFQKENVLLKVQRKVKWLKQHMEAFLNLEHVGEIRQCGMMVGIELVKTRSPKAEYPLIDKIGIRVCQKVREYGVILRSLGTVIVIMPPLSIRQRELQKILEATYQAIKDVTEKKFQV
jgi:adenosylmethionine-8-amino-7-oxononanoate transaminase